MTAVRVLQGGGWIVHSLQQDGVLAEPGRLTSGAPAAPLTALTPRASQAIRAEHGLSIEMIEKGARKTLRRQTALINSKLGSLVAACFRLRGPPHPTRGRATPVGVRGYQRRSRRRNG